MSGVVNLRQVRKAKRRAEADVTAAANRLRFGRTRAEREGVAKEADRSARALDGARVDASASDGEMRLPDPSRDQGG